MDSDGGKQLVWALDVNEESWIVTITPPSDTPLNSSYNLMRALERVRLEILVASFMEASKDA